MDMTGAMPRSAWYEIVGDDDELLASVPAQIRGGSIWAELPTFDPGAYGRIELCTIEVDGTTNRDQGRLEELPTQPQVRVVQMG